jgi:hypothetical protein
MRSEMCWGRTLRFVVTVASLVLAVAGCESGQRAAAVTQRTGAALSAAPSPNKGSGLVWHLPNGEVHVWDMATGTDPKEVVLPYNVDPSTWRIVATGDFNGDGQGDLLWDYPAAGLLTEWLLNDTSVPTTTNATQNAPVSVQTVQGQAQPFAPGAYPVDIDGDAVTDVVWREVSMTVNSGPYGAPQITTDNIRTEEWMLTSGQTVPKYDAYLDSPTSSVAAAGDFDGDAYGDFVFRDSSTGDTQIVFSPGYWVDYGAVPLNWSIMGSGDFNNDGADDLLWYDTTGGYVAIWFMEPGTGNIAAGPWFQNVPVDSGWTIDGVADTNHDGISDIIWEHSSGVISIWTMNADATVADYGATLAKPYGATFAGVIPLGPPPPFTGLKAVNLQANGGEVDALIEFQGQAARANDYVEIWTGPYGANLGRVPTFQVSGNTLGAWLNTAWLQGGTSGCFAVRPWEQGRTSTTWSDTVCLTGYPNPLQGHVDFANQPDNNRCVPDPAHILNRMNPNGGLLAWHYSAAGYTPLDSDEYHTETIVRMPYLDGTPLDGSIFAADFSHEKCDNPGTIGDCGAHLGVATLGYTGGRLGRMLGGNRGYWGPNGRADWWTIPTPNDPNNPAALGDTFVPLGSSQPTPHFNMSLDDPNENHPGGASALGHYLVTGIQAYDTGCAGFFDLYSCNPIYSRGIVQIWDLTSPFDPKKLSSFTTYENYDLVKAKGAGKDAVGVAMTKLNDGRFLVAMITDTPLQQMEFYVSQSTTLDTSNVFGTNERAPDAVWPVGTPHSFADMQAKVPEWQSFNILTGCDGTLWAIGGRDENDDTRYPGPDSVDLYQLTITQGGSCGTPYCVTMTPASEAPAGDHNARPTRGMNCSDNNGSLQCTFAAGFGAYVDPDGNVVLYGTEYDNDGSTGSFVHGNGVGGSNLGYYPAQGGYIRGKEFHERHGNNGPNAGCPTLDRAWVEFYSQTDYNNDNWGDASGQIFYQDYATQSLRNPDFGVNNFAGKAQSVRWCLPPGTFYQVKNASGASAYLAGSGVVVEGGNLNLLTYPNGGGNAGQSITSGQFIVDGSNPSGQWSGFPDSSN